MNSRRRQPIDRTCVAVLPSSQLVIGDGKAASAFDLMRSLDVRCILNVTTDIVEPHQSELGPDIEWHRIPLQDTENEEISEALNEAMGIIDEVAAAGGKILVHCHEGRSRSVTVCLAYLITRNYIPLADALDFVKAHRPQAQPNPGFLKQLMALERSTLGTSSLRPQELPKGRPKCLSCEICGQSVGLKSALASHLKLKHDTDAATVAAVGVPAIIEKELTALLQRVNPSKVANIPNLLEKYAGREQELLAQVTAKYAGA